MTEHVLYAVEDGTAWITLNRPEALNAQNRAMRDRLRACFRDAATITLRTALSRAASRKQASGRSPSAPT